jgi:hypothetical protein
MTQYRLLYHVTDCKYVKETETEGKKGEERERKRTGRQEKGRRQGEQERETTKRHGRMARGGYGLPKVSPEPAMPNPSTPCRQATPETALQPFQGRYACRAGGLRPSSTPLDTPRRTPTGREKKGREKGERNEEEKGRKETRRIKGSRKRLRGWGWESHE